MLENRSFSDSGLQRIRHIHSIYGRNIVWKSQFHKEPIEKHKKNTLESEKGEKPEANENSLLLQAHFTLHLNATAPAFYTSETVANTKNPAFRLIIQPHLIDWFDFSLSKVVVRLWGKRAMEHDKELRLIVEWHLDLGLLSKIGNSFSDLIYYKFPENTVVLELADGFYCSEDIANRRPGSLEKKTDTSKLKRSYTYSHIIKLNTLKDCIFDTKRSSAEVRDSAEDMLKKSDDGLRLNRTIDHHKCSLVELESKVILQKKRNHTLKEKLKSVRESIESRKNQLKLSMGSCKSSFKGLEDNHRTLDSNMKMRHNKFQALNKRRKELVADLFCIYPIEQSYDDSQQFSIRGVCLPNSGHDGKNNESIATALGFTVHLVSLLAFYLEIPLRYPTKYMGSRATIKDLISLISGYREFPLYAKGVDPYRYEFGVFLLNKNIEQLMNAYGLIVMDLRHTLPNIHYFIQAILTTSVNCGPKSISMLSISSFANGGGGSLKPKSDDEEPEHHGCHRLQPKQNGDVVTVFSPSSSTHLPTKTMRSPNHVALTTFLSTPQPMAATSTLDTVTASSCCHGE
ncbi:UV radiation resistance protein and autophagy-related subunit 14-domain-containing protein [Sporodiniella umbellata]|nr:UV radiation resistance protein and autophagy-related subunit 14-domain-containing protein [Sporodiniella umbellata]